MAQKAGYREFLKTGFTMNRFRWPLVLWAIILTTGLLITIKGLTEIEIIESILLTVVVCFFSFFEIRYFSDRNLNIFPDLLKVGCIVLLIVIFGYWGMVYSSFFLIILVIYAFHYSFRDFAIVFFAVAVSLGAVWWFQVDPIYQSALFKNSFFLIVSNSIFALGILLRIFARESLSMQKRERELEVSQNNLKKDNAEMIAIFNNMENAIFSLDKNNNIYFANKSAIDIFPVLKTQSLDKALLDRLMLADATGTPISLKEVVEKSVDKKYRSDLTATVNGKVFSYNSLVTKIYDDEKNYSGAMISLHSLTADEMLEKSRMEFASLASHEIRTPLTVIEGYLSLMLINKEFEYNKMTKEYLTTLHDTTTDLIKLSNGILSMSKIDEGSVRVDIEKTDLSELVKDTVKGQIELAKSRGLDINSNISKVPIIETDKTKVGEILRNLIENAIKFSVKGEISVILDQIGNEVVLSVEDSGIGIPEGSKEKIFGKFFQVENWDTRKNSGSGLGLYVSKSMARRIGGDLILETTSKKGSKFSLMLPLKYPNLDDLTKYKDVKLKEFIEGF